MISTCECGASVEVTREGATEEENQWRMVECPRPDCPTSLRVLGKVVKEEIPEREDPSEDQA